jgi:predicted RNA-binding Zn-ribbon protein involved in translation (DUF1610 family)
VVREDCGRNDSTAEICHTNSRAPGGAESEENGMSNERCPSCGAETEKIIHWEKTRGKTIHYACHAREWWDYDKNRHGMGRGFPNSCLWNQLQIVRAENDALGAALLAAGYDVDAEVASKPNTPPVSQNTALDTIREFVARVNARAETAILSTGVIEGAHHRALDAELRDMEEAGS